MNLIFEHPRYDLKIYDGDWEYINGWEDKGITFDYTMRGTIFNEEYYITIDVEKDWVGYRFSHLGESGEIDYLEDLSGEMEGEYPIEPFWLASELADNVVKGLFFNDDIIRLLQKYEEEYLKEEN